MWSHIPESAAPVDRAVPAMVGEPVRQQAQEALDHNVRFGQRNRRILICCRGWSNAGCAS
jgi:Arc/MetJ family transcription regulator